VMFTSDNFNKYPEAAALLEAMAAERIRLPFFVQCDTQVERQEGLVALLARAGCFQVFVGAESFSREALKAAHKLQNHPERYARILDLCRAHGITVHFSSILGFPTDTEETVLEHLARLRELDPDLSSFYVLTPIPGTDQYADFRERGWITEGNLDRFDGACVTWRHPNLAPGRWTDLLRRSYREVSGAGPVARRLGRALRSRWDYRMPGKLLSIAGYALQSRLAVRAGAHPMAGGIGRVRRDGVADYAHLRRRTWGFDLAPLPDNLALSPADEELNRRAKLRVAG
ncbi:MAG TPA: radical SAM protein, partial [Thermoanaerobaculia bacterium]|nr:radical SAM protein [Thermoanaerobaculia bacterium]